MPTTDPRFDAYIKAARPAVQPTLKEIRAAVHAACPDVVETVKWRIPSFEYQGLMCGMAAFKQYTTMAFWKSVPMKERLSDRDVKALELVGRLTANDALPGRATLVRLVKAAMALNDEGVPMNRATPSRKKPPVKAPPALMAALKKHPKALSAYQALPPSHKREYVEWIAEAKQDETRQRRLTQAVTWIAEGKSRNWKYETRTK